MIRRLNYKRLLLLAALPAFLLASCSQEEMGSEPGTQNGEIRFEISFAPMGGASQTAPCTRVATDTQFNSTWEDGDEIGIFAVEHGKELAASGNPLHNVKLTYDSANDTWSGPAYWPAAASGITALDFFAYYPYDATATDPMAITFNVKADQSATTNIGGTEKSNHNLSDLLTAKADNRGHGYARGTTVSLAFSHALAMVQVKVNRAMVGNYAPDALHVWLNGCASDCVLNLSTQSAAQPSNPASAEKIRMYACPNDGNAPGIYAYRALVPRQTIASGSALFRFAYAGNTLLRSEPSKQPLSLVQGQAEMFDMTFPFTSATVSSNVRLAHLFTDDELAAITHLRVLGEMASIDFDIIRNKMHALTDLDLSGATVGNDAIPYQALRDKKGLKRFAFPRNLKKIASYAFSGCSGLTGSLTIPEGVTTIGSSAFSGCSGFTGSLTIPQSVTTIDGGAFSRCSGFTGSLTIPEGVTTINSYAFSGCSGFNGSLNIPEGVATIGASAFFECSGFNGPLTIPESVTTIYDSAFYDCRGFTGPLTIPPGVKTINIGTFSGCSGLTGPLTIPEGVTTIGTSAFYGCSGFTGSLTIPQSVTRIEDFAFGSCSKLTGSLKIPESVTWIGEGAFRSCSGLTGSPTIPSGVTTISNGTFRFCSSFTGNLTIPQNVTSIGDGAFDGCSGFTGNLTIPENVKTIGERAFWGCSGFNGSLTIPQGVTTIAHEAFFGCSKLRTITCHLPEPDKAAYGYSVFDEVPANIPVYVPKAAVKAYKNHSVWGRFTNIQAIPQS